MTSQTTDSSMSPPASNPQTSSLSMETLRRDHKRLLLLERVLLLTSVAFLVWLCLEVFIRERRDTIYLLLSIYGSLSGIGRFFVWKVRAVPAPLLTLAHGTAPEREQAWLFIDVHRDALFAMTHLPASINEPDLGTLGREALIARIERHGTTNWRKILKVFLAVWLVGLTAVIVAVLLHTPASVVTLRSIRS
jgi:hypothetical protein